MNKRSAMTVAAGLVAALVSAVGAVSVSLAGRSSVQAQSPSAAKPIVKTIRRTITIHRKPKQSPAPIQVVTAAPRSTTPSAPVTVSSGSLAPGSGSGEGDEGGERGGDD
jgi:hypothetical protein